MPSSNDICAHAIRPSPGLTAPDLDSESQRCFVSRDSRPTPTTTSCSRPHFHHRRRDAATRNIRVVDGGTRIFPLGATNRAALFDVESPGSAQKTHGDGDPPAAELAAASAASRQHPDDGECIALAHTPRGDGIRLGYGPRRLFQAGAPGTENGVRTSCFEEYAQAPTKIHR